MALPRKLTEKQIRSAGRKSKAKKRSRKKADRANSCSGKIRHSPERVSRYLLNY